MNIQHVRKFEHKRTYLMYDKLDKEWSLGEFCNEKHSGTGIAEFYLADDYNTTVPVTHGYFKNFIVYELPKKK